MSKLDDILSEVPRWNAAGTKEAAKQQVKELFLELVEDAYTERRKQEARKDGYETGTRLVKRLLKKKVEAL